MAGSIRVADYLLTRLKQLGVQSIHGVPGDYNLTLLDYVEQQGLHWVGNCNELNAGYAADAYSRIKGLGALITTFGVGELSAANAIAGAYAELAPVVHIVGTPARKLQAERAKVHHTLNDGDFRRFAQMYTHITVAQADLSNPLTCPSLIDSTIQQCLLHSRPVYLALPADMVSVMVDAAPLQSKIDLPKFVPSNEEQQALTVVKERMYSSKRPMILVDGESRAYGILDQLNQLVTTTQWPTFVTVFGKSCVYESLTNFRGIWKGKFASVEEKEFVKSSDLILCFGPHFSNTNTYGYSSVPDAATTVMFTLNTMETREKVYRDLPAKQFLSKLLDVLDKTKLTKPAAAPIMNGTPSLQISKESPNSPLTQDLFYRVFSQWLRKGDVILAETGTAGHGCRDFELPSHTFLFKPSTWLSIGYMLPATQGAALAQRELHNAGQWQSENGPRTILLIGDGSFQMTAQELSIIIREKLNVLLVLINNDGYTIERCLHGWNMAYNDIPTWRYLQAPSFFGASETKEGSGYHAQTHRVENWGELEAVMLEHDRSSGSMLRMVEVIMGREDAPVTLLDHLRRQKEAAAVQ